MGLHLDPATRALLVDLVARLLQEPHNLTAVRRLDDAVDRHLADSLAGLTLPEIAAAPDLVDLGSGGGFPGLALAAARPDAAVTLVESAAKKADWLRRASARFPNVRVVHRRSESLARDGRERWSAVTVRAVAAPPAALELAAPLVAPGGSAVLWRGEPRAEEIRAGDAAAEQLGFAPAQVRPVAPFPAAQRHFLVYRKERPTAARFPRRPGRATSRPLA